jgi:beta-lactamase superfamily II metal-dependent hydrolase
MLDFKQTFTIHPVGQGLFYSLTFEESNRTNFRMVVDCGSLSPHACQPEIQSYRDKDFISANTLDLLIITHFDADHVNHISSLLTGGIIIRKLIMPFVNNAFRHLSRKTISRTKASE